MVDEFDNALKELRAHTTALWTVVDLDLDMFNSSPLVRCGILPPHQAIRDKIVCLEGDCIPQQMIPVQCSFSPN